MKEKIILVGGGGHCKACIDVIEQAKTFQIAGIVDMKDRLHEKVLGYEIIGYDDNLPELVKQHRNFLVTKGQIENPAVRIRLFKSLKELGAIFPVIVSPLAYVSGHAILGEGTIVMHHAVINAGARVGRNCIVNSKALVEHDAIIGDHCHISTGAIVNGGVRVGEETFFGSNVSTREYIKIGKRSIIGLNAKAFKDVPDGSFVK